MISRMTLYYNKYEHSVCLICGCVVEGPRIETAVLLPVLTDHNIAQTGELLCTKVLVPQVVARGK